MKIWLKALAVCLAIVIILSGCNIGDDKEQEEKSAKGRYMETEVKLPEGVTQIKGIDQLEDGSFIMLCNINNYDDFGPWVTYQSTDGGQTWEEVNSLWLEEMDDHIIRDMLFTGKDSGFIYFEEYNKERSNEIESFFEQNKDEEAYDLMDETLFIGAVENGTIRKYEDFSVFETNGIAPRGLEVLSSGDLFLDHYFNYTVLSVNEGKVLYKGELETEDYGTRNYHIYDDKVAYSTNKEIRVHNLETGEQEKTIEIQNQVSEEEATNDLWIMNIMTKDKQADAFYYCNATGIYRTTADETLAEKIVDNSLNSLGMPSESAKELYVNDDGSFLVLAGNYRQGKLFYYSFDETIPTVPATELKVYSLIDNRTIRQAIGVFQKENPNVKITYMIGKKNQETVFQDAIRALSTQILAGDGPDVIVMDGIPIESYIEKGVLLDITDVIEPMVQSGTLLPNIIKGHSGGDKIYSVPAQFSVLMMQGVGIENVNSIKELYNWYEEQPVKNFGLYKDDIQELYPLYAENWINDDRTVNKEQVLQTLKDLQELSTVMHTYDEDGYPEEASIAGDFESGGVYWSGKAVAANIGSLNTLEALAAPEAAMRQKGEGEINFLPDVDGGRFQPKTILGINANSNQIDNAKAFLTLALSEEVLSAIFYNGLPTNRDALVANSIDPNLADVEYTSYWSVGVTKEDGSMEQIELKFRWPDEAFMNDFVAKLERITVPVEEDIVVERIVFDPVYNVMMGDLEPEKASEMLIEELELYLAEQQ